MKCVLWKIFISQFVFETTLVGNCDQNAYAICEKWKIQIQFSGWLKRKKWSRPMFCIYTHAYTNLLNYGSEATKKCNLINSLLIEIGCCEYWWWWYWNYDPNVFKIQMISSIFDDHFYIVQWYEIRVDISK